MKECGTCTACCDGLLHGNIHGHFMGNGKPCFFLDKGCTIYEDRPEYPCKSFKCLWLEEEFVPDFMKPEIAGCIPMVSQTKSGIKFLNIVERDTPIPDQVLQYAFRYVEHNEMLVFWSVNQVPRYVGDKVIFDEIMEHGIF